MLLLRFAFLRSRGFLVLGQVQICHVRHRAGELRGGVRRQPGLAALGFDAGVQYAAAQRAPSSFSSSSSSPHHRRPIAAVERLGTAIVVAVAVAAAATVTGVAGAVAVWAVVVVVMVLLLVVAPQRGLDAERRILGDAVAHVLMQLPHLGGRQELARILATSARVTSANCRVRMKSRRSWWLLQQIVRTSQDDEEDEDDDGDEEYEDDEGEREDEPLT